MIDIAIARLNNTAIKLQTSAPHPVNEIEDRHFAEVFHKKSRSLEKIVLISLIIVKRREKF